jgi:hypothetical protein
MKQLQVGIELVKGKGFQLNWHSLFKKRTLKPVAMKARSQQVSHPRRLLVSIPFRSPLEVLRQRTAEGLRRLESQAEHINQLSTELEAAMLEFKAIASEINPDSSRTRSDVAGQGVATSDEKKARVARR